MVVAVVALGVLLSIYSTWTISTAERDSAFPFLFECDRHILVQSRVPVVQPVESGE